MGERSKKLWFAYGAAITAVLAAALVAESLPILRERFTLFLFWPVVVAVAWFGGAGPAILATTLSAGIVALVIGPTGVGPIGQPQLVLVTLVFATLGVTAALVARWRQDADASLRESHDRFSTLANAAPILIWMAGSDTQRTYFNRQWLDFTGRSLERELGGGWLESVHPDDRARCEESYAEAIRAKRPFEIEYRLRRADGEYRCVLDRGTPQLSPGGEVVGYIGSSTDITDHREALTAAERARSDAEAASRAKDAFLATVSHELRAPLSPILTWVRMLQSGRLPSDQTTRALEVIERNARMQAQLIEDLLDVARIVEGKLRLQVRPVALADVVQNALETICPAAAKGIRLQVVLDTTSPAIPGDPDRLQQVVWNLLANAVNSRRKKDACMSFSSA